jgi:excisionase family DNA binding protein
MEQQLLKVAEVATRLSCSQSMVRNLIKSGRLRHVRLGKGQGGIRVTVEALTEFIRASEQGGQPKPPAQNHRPQRLMPL